MVKNWKFAYCETGNPNKIRTKSAEWDTDCIDLSHDYSRTYKYVSATYPSCSREQMTANIKRDGWWFKDGKEAKDCGDFPVDECYI